MLESHERFRMVDLSLRDTGVHFEVNWNPEDKKSNNCKILKMILPNGSEHFIDKKILIEMLFAIGTGEEQKKMIPQNLQTVHWRKTILGVKAAKDIAKGQMINFPIEISFPCDNKEIIGEIKPSVINK